VNIHNRFWPFFQEMPELAGSIPSTQISRRRLASRAVPLCGCPVIHDHQRAAGDVQERGQRLGGGDGGKGGDGVDIGEGHLHVNSIQATCFIASIHELTFTLFT